MDDITLEERYIVYKIKGRYDSRAEFLDDVLKDWNVKRVGGFLVIEADWPEYEPTKAMLLARIKGGG